VNYEVIDTNTFTHGTGSVVERIVLAVQVKYTNDQGFNNLAVFEFETNATDQEIQDRIVQYGTELKNSLAQDLKFNFSKTGTI
jgi:hypothetical protein